MSDPALIRFETVSTGDKEADAIAAIGKVMSWLYCDYASKETDERLRDGAAVDRVARYIKERYAAS